MSAKIIVKYLYLFFKFQIISSINFFQHLHKSTIFPIFVSRIQRVFDISSRIPWLGLESAVRAIDFHSICYLSAPSVVRLRLKLFISQRYTCQEW